MNTISGHPRQVLAMHKHIIKKKYTSLHFTCGVENQIDMSIHCDYDHGNSNYTAGSLARA